MNESTGKREGFHRKVPTSMNEVDVGISVEGGNRGCPWSKTLVRLEQGAETVSPQHDTYTVESNGRTPTAGR